MNVPCSDICASSGIPIPWVSELIYLGIYILKSRSFKCSLPIHRKAFYCSANTIFGKVGRIASEEVVLELHGGPKKTAPNFSGNNFGKYGPILIMFSLLHSQMN